ncbi:MAG: AAA family ATPase [bacterium]|nr:AAA family ATPase [bacterium]
MLEGDLVIVKDGRKILGLGIVGNYFEDKNDSRFNSYNKGRKVKWIAELSKDKIELKNIKDRLNFDISYKRAFIAHPEPNNGLFKYDELENIIKKNNPDKEIKWIDENDIINSNNVLQSAYNTNSETAIAVENLGNKLGSKPTLEGFKAYLKSKDKIDENRDTPDRYCKKLEYINKDGYKQLLNEDISFDEFCKKIVNNERLEEVYDRISKKGEGIKDEKTIDQYKRVVNYFIDYCKSLDYSNNTEASQQAASDDKLQDNQQDDNSASGKRQSYVFIIDEINRGNISKIFGELITLIEDTKREGEDEAASAILPYSGESFSVPKNVYILGTMNTADRSIALMDTALRRRFNFVEMMPDLKPLKDLTIKAEDSNGQEIEIHIDKMLRAINDRIEYLYDREHTIGHAFFMKLKKEPTIEVLADIFRNKIIPLLQEYFYDDYAKIRLVLGGNFIEPKNVSLDELFGKSNLNNNKNDYNELDKTTVYKITDNFNDSNSYLGIYLTQEQIEKLNNSVTETDESPYRFPQEEMPSAAANQVDGISSSTDTSSEETS